MNTKLYPKLLTLAIGMTLASPSFAIHYVYDDLNRLVSVNYSSSQKIEYKYDAAGNLLSIQPTFSMKDVVVTLLDAKGEKIIGAEIALTVNGQLVTVKDGDDGVEDGKYTISSLQAKEYRVKVTKDGMEYPDASFIVGAGTEVLLAVRETFPPEVTDQNLVIVGAYACDANYVSILEPSNGAVFHSFNPEIDARGLYLKGVDFDHDKLTDIATGGIGKGKEMLLYNTSRKLLGRIISNGDDKGVQIDFGDLDGTDSGDFEIVVTNQSVDQTVNMYESNGKAIRGLKVLDKKTKINIATGDTDGDGVDELIVVLAEKADKNNVLRFDQKGTLLGSFTAQPNDKKTSGLTVTVADVNGDGKDEIVVAEAEKDDHYGVAVYGSDGALHARFNAFAGSGGNLTQRAADKVAVCHNGQTLTIANSALKAHLAQGDTEGACEMNSPVGENDYNFAKCKDSAYKSDGLLLASGDVNGDGKADIIVAHAGYRTVKLFDGEGKLINWFIGAKEGYQITALSYGESMGLKLPEPEVLPPDVMENITVTGKPGKPRPVIDGQKIRGTVRVANVLIIKVEIEIGARLELSLGVRFASRAGIPNGLDLSGTCHKKKAKHNKVNRGKKKYQKQMITKKEQQSTQDIEVLDLSTPVMDQAPSVLDDIKVLTGADVNTRRMGLRREGEAIQITQNAENGNVELRQGDVVIQVTPVGMEQAALDAPAGIVIDPDGMVHATTAQGQLVHFHAAVQDMDAFAASLDENGNLQNLEVDDDGQLRAYYHNLPGAYHVGRADFTSTVLMDSSIPNGIHSANKIYPSLGGVGVVLVFTENGVKRWQWIWPSPADREALTTLAENNSSLGAITLHYNGAGNPAGTISFVLNGQKHLATFDYLVRTGMPPSSGATEINFMDNGQYEIIYPNGDRQSLILLK